ncbi:MAG: copper homeostasis protein CutC [Clostridia bacterium]|nr:copper homeostasis protein CutC [Clostridia bacterium]
MDITIEVCCQSAGDALTAAKCGADRVELNSSLHLGGLTPSVGAVEFVKQYSSIPVIVMIRPRQGGFCYDRDELEVMARDIRALLRAGADGVAFGCLRVNGTVDVSACMRLLDETGGHESVFHRAFDMIIGQDFRPALDAIAALGFSRVLTSGGESTAVRGIPVLRQLRAYAPATLEILPCGKVRADNAARIIRETGCRSVHTSAFLHGNDATSAYNPKVGFTGEPPEEGAYPVCDADALTRFIQNTRGRLAL